MSDVTLRKAMIRLAAQREDLRPHLLPLLAPERPKTAGMNTTLDKVRHMPYVEVEWNDEEGKYMIYFTDGDPQYIWTEDSAALMKWLKQLETRAKKAQAELRKLTQKNKKRK